MTLGDSLQKVKFECTFAIKCRHHKCDCVNYICRKMNVCSSETVKCPMYIKDRNLNLSDMLIQILKSFKLLIFMNVKSV